MDDIVSGLNEWRNIQTVVRKTFKRLHGIVVSQGDRITKLEKQLAMTATKSELDSMELSLSNRPTFLELENIMSGYVQRLEQQVASQNLHLSSKVDKIELKDVYASLSNAAKNSRKLDALIDEMQQMKLHYGEFQADLKDLRSNLKKLDLVTAKKKVIDEDIDVRNKKMLEFCDSQIVLRSNAAFARIAEIEEEIKQLMDDTVREDDFKNALQNVPTRVETEQTLNKKFAEVCKTIEDFKKLVLNETITGLDEKVDKEVFKELLETKVDKVIYENAICEKVEKEDIDLKLSEAKSSLTKQVSTLMAEIQSEVVIVLNRKAFKTELQQVAESKLDFTEVSTLLEKKMDVEKFEQLEEQLIKTHLVNIENKIKSTTASKHSHKKLKFRLHDVESSLSTISAAKLNSQAKHDMEEMKAQSARLQKRLEKFRLKHEHMDSMLSKQAADIHDILQKQTIFIEDLDETKKQVKDGVYMQQTSQRYMMSPTRDNDKTIGLRSQLKAVEERLQSLTSISRQNAYARWIWKSNKLVTGSMGRYIPWDLEATNSSDAIFEWKPGVSTIGIKQPGLYQLLLGIFTQKEPNLKVLVDDEPVFRTSLQAKKRGRNTTRSIQESKTPETPRISTARLSHSKGNISGWTMVEFLALPPNSKLSIVLDSVDLGCVQGFLALKKL